MKLADLPLEGARFDPRFAGLPLAGISADSRKVKPGDLFVAVPGIKSDGLSFVPQALAAGAAAVMAEKPTSVPAQIAFIHVANARRALALAAAAFFPRQPQTIAAVTGTSGKTSVAAFTRQIWSALGEPAASIGTIGVVSPRGEVYGSLTTPDPIELHRTLDRLAGEGVTHLALEASSHGLDQHRLDGVRVTAGAFTNLSRDHLDYHPSIEAYLAAKLRLFEALIAPGGTAVIGVDDCYAGQVVAVAIKRGLKIVTVGEQGDDIKLLSGEIDGFAQVVRIAHGGKTYKIKLPLVGGFQVQNAAIAAGLAIATGSDAGARVRRAGEAARRQGPAGASRHQKRRADLRRLRAHAGRAQEGARSLAPVRQGQAGRGVRLRRRPRYRQASDHGRIAAENADRVIVTDDNPRSEQPAAIRAAILAEAQGRGRDRRPRASHPRRHRRTEKRRRAADRRQGP